MKEIHFFASNFDMSTWLEVHDFNVNMVKRAYDYNTMERFRKAMDEVDGDIAIATIQMSFLSTEWLAYGYQVFVHDNTGMFEIVLGGNNERTSREIRLGHSLFRLWAGGEFGLREEDD